MSHHRLGFSIQGSEDVADVPHGDEPLYCCRGVRRCDKGQTFVAISGMRDLPPGHLAPRDYKR
jgi:hypothetical protein